MNKKGFTLIEIIVCIILIATVGVSTVIVVNKKNKTYDENINKKILEAANVFVEVEKDENGNNYLEEIVKGAKGVKVPVSMLVDKGYIDKGIEKKLYKNTTKKDGESYYVMFLNNGDDYCKDDSEITTIASWMYDGKPVYLCNNYESSFNSLEYIKKNVKLKYSEDKFAVSNDFILNNGLSTSDKYTSEENGIYMFHHNVAAGNFVYIFYRGAVENNYIKLGQKIIKDAEGNETALEDLYWRIVWLRDDNKMKIVLDDTIPVYIKNKTGESLDVTDKKLYTLKENDRYDSSEKTYIFLAKDLNTEVVDSDDYEYNLYLPEEKYWVESVDFDNEAIYLYENDTFYMKKMKEWYDSTDLDTYNFITDSQNFCINNFLYEFDSYTDRYYPSKNFDCAKGEMERSSSLPDYSEIPDYYDSKIGFLTYGDCIMAGIKGKDGENLANSGNYLIKDNNTFAIQDLKSYYVYRPSNKVGSERKYHNYFVGPTGLLDGVSYNKDIDSSGYTPTYQIYDSTKTNLLIENYRLCDYNAYCEWIEYYNFFANSIKPAMIIDLTNYKLSNNSGTINDYYTIIPK